MKTKTTAALLLFLLLLVLGSPPAGADSGSPPVEPLNSMAGTLSYRLLAGGMDDMTLDETGALTGRTFWLEQRLRLGAEIKRGSLKASFQGDLFSGQLAGDTTQVGARYLDHPRDELDVVRGFMLRQAMISWRTICGELRIGQQVSDWGLGLLANGGERELPFGNPRLGDLVERLAFFTRPVPHLYVGLGGDLVFRDSNAQLLEGDLGVNAFAAVFFNLRRHFVGLYGAFRTQWDRDDERLEVGILDIHARSGAKLPWGLSWEAAVEGLLEVGRTSRIRAEPDLEGTDILAGGVVARAALAHKTSRLKLTVELGYASGDNDLNDDTMRQLQFHPEHRVGLILFNEYSGALTARAADRLADAKHQGQAPHGVRHVPSGGRVGNAIYLWPHLALGPFWGATLRAGVLWARAAADVVDPYTTNNLSGGFNSNYFGAASGSRELGVEVQAGAEYRLELMEDLELGAALQWAHLFPGAAFNGAQGQGQPDLDRVVGRLTLKLEVH